MKTHTKHRTEMRRKTKIIEREMKTKRKEKVRERDRELN